MFFIMFVFHWIHFFSIRIFFTIITHITNVNVEEFFSVFTSLGLSPEPIMLNNCLCGDGDRTSKG